MFFMKMDVFYENLWLTSSLAGKIGFCLMNSLKLAADIQERSIGHADYFTNSFGFSVP